MKNDEKIFAGSIFYYGSVKGATGCVRYTIAMKDKVDGKILNDAVQKAFTRYPYLKKHIEKRWHGIVMVDNPAPIAVLHTSKQITLNSAQTNGHLIAITWDNNYIWFHNTHGIMDGRGRHNVLHTIMYYYCQARYNEEVKMDKVILCDTPIDPAEYVDPFMAPIPAPEETIKLRPGIGFTDSSEVLDLGKEANITRTEEAYTKILSLSEKELIDMCKREDATPNTSVSLLIMRAINRLCPNSEKSPVVAVCADIREALGYPKTHQSTTAWAKLILDKQMLKMDIAEQSVILRGQLLLSSSTSALRVAAKSLRKMMKLYNLPITLNMKNRLAIKSGEKLKSSFSAMVSYSGKSTYGSCDQHIHGFMSVPYVALTDLLVEITAADGLIYLAWTQLFKEDVLFDAFLKEIQEQGLTYELLGSELTDGPKLDFSKTEEQLGINISSAESFLTAKLSGQIGDGSLDKLSKQLQPLIDQAGKTIILDCTSLEYISSKGLKYLMSIHDEAKNTGGKVILKNVSGDLKTIFDESGFSSIFTEE